LGHFQSKTPKFNRIIVWNFRISWGYTNVNIDYSSWPRGSPGHYNLFGSFSELGTAATEGPTANHLEGSQYLQGWQDRAGVKGGRGYITTNNMI
jgi:hypothetical protein